MAAAAFSGGLFSREQSLDFATTRSISMVERGAASKGGCSHDWLDSVGINRRGVVNERVIQERSSDHPGPEPCEGDREAALEALDRGICGLGIELRKRQSGEPTASASTEGNRAVRVNASVPYPAESKTAC